MAPIAKENEILTARTVETAAPSAAAATLPNEGASKSQPVALEVAVTVNGARAVDGSDKREPFSESTKTVLVFGSGAVIRLQSPVAPGQLLFLTNDKTKKEVVCQVVKSKNYRNVSGYVELEFTEAVVGFWGMRFPSDRIGGGPSATAGTASSPAVSKSISQPGAVSAPTQAVAPALPRPDATANFNALKALASTPVPPVTVPEVKPVATLPPPAMKEVAPVAGDPSTEALKQQTARLQEQLSSMLFAERASAKAAPPPAPVAKQDVQENTAKILEFVKPEPRQVTVTPVIHEAPKNTVLTAPKAVPPAESAPGKSLLDEEEVKIPSWLEPLARNAANVSAAEETTTRTEVHHKEEPVFESHIAPEPEADFPAGETEAATLTFETNLLEPEHSGAGSSRGSNKGLLIGMIAAGLVLAAAGGAWFVRNQAGATPSSAVGAPVTSAAVVRTGPQASTQASTQASGPSVNGPAANSAANSPVPSAPLSSATYSAPAASSAGGNRGGNQTVNNAVVKTPQPAPAQTAPPLQIESQPKKPALGEVRLAAPTISHKGQAQTGNETETGISLGNSEAVPNDALGSGLANHTKGPAAPAEPLPVGGDVKPAKLLMSVSPMYPSLAKNQHVSGDVRVDALIDETGKVTTMKVVAGPTLLQQAAMDALRQWRYQPATLDGKAVPMHLTVTLQFRLQ
jgi:protein TonB